MVNVVPIFIGVQCCASFSVGYTDSQSGAPHYIGGQCRVPKFFGVQ